VSSSTSLSLKCRAVCSGRAFKFNARCTEVFDWCAALLPAAAQDLAWEGTTAGPIRTAPVQRWIEGKAGL
jgi:hypothetical protein